MDGAPLIIKLENENRRTFMILRIIFNQNGCCRTGNHIPHKNIVGCQFIITMSRNSYLAFANKMNNIPQCLTHKPIIDEAGQCVNEVKSVIVFTLGGA